MWIAILADAGQGTIARPHELDLIEELFSGTPAVRNAVYDYVLAHAGNPAGFDWQTIARDFGISAESLLCFLGWDEPDVIVQGIVDAIREARALEVPLKFATAIGLFTNVTSVITCDEHGVRNAVVVTIAAPAR